MPVERTKRQDPVSCQQCRQKKLRCDRQIPCANCRSRDLTCIYSNPGPPAARTLQNYGVNTTDLEVLIAENRAINARLQKLENLVVHHRDSRSSSNPDTVADSPFARRPTPSPEVETFNVGTHDSRWLDGVATQRNDQSPDLFNPIPVRIAKLSEIIDRASSAMSRHGHVLIPPLDDALRLFEQYIKRTDTLQYIIHERTVILMVRSLYEQIQYGQPYEFSQLALVLNLMASIAAYWGYGEQDGSLFPNQVISGHVATYWLRAALNVLEQARRSQTPTLVTVQASLVVIFLLYHTEGFSPKVRILHATTVSLAKDIGLHLTDSSAPSEEQKESRDHIIDREIRRRIWWHLVAVDWGLSIYSGPQEHTYIINANHMRVRKPRNLNDEDLELMPFDFNRPLSEPTQVLYFIYCLKCGEICREVADATWEYTGSDVDDATYDNVFLPLVKKFDNLLLELPSFLQIDYPDRGIETSTKRFKMQRYFTNLSIQVRRCKVHLPFLLRAERNKRYEFSRNACLDAARKMLQLRHHIPKYKDSWFGDGVYFRFASVLHHYFCAVVVLVMDLCVNQVSGQEEERKAEIRSACTIFEDARQQFASAGVFLDALAAVLHKHKVRLQTHETDAITGPSGHFSPAIEDSSAMQYGASEMSTIATQTSMSNLDLNGLWQGYFEMGTHIDPRDLDAVFSDLDQAIQ